MSGFLEILFSILSNVNLVLLFLNQYLKMAGAENQIIVKKLKHIQLIMSSFFIGMV